MTDERIAVQLQSDLVPEQPPPAADHRNLLTFVCCAEAGGLEEQTVRMVESLRRWGGTFARCPVVAVSPRLGVPLSRNVLDRLERLGVQYLAPRANRRHAWFKYMNKPHALVVAAEVARTEQLCWVDSDIFFLEEPSALTLGPSEDLVACPSDRNIGTTGEDEHTPYWDELTRLFGLTVADMPSVTALVEQVPIRFYFNSGVFTFRISTGFARRYLEGCERILDSRTASHASKIFFTDQVALGLVALTMGLRWRALPLSHNFPMTSRGDDGYVPGRLRSTALFHYHDYLWPQHFQVLVERLEAERPEVARWVRAAGAIGNRLPFGWKVVNAALRNWRERRTNQWVKQCRMF